MLSQLKVPLALAASILIYGCASSPTEEDFGNSVRNMVAKQQMPSSGTLKADEPLQSGDGRRLDNVNTVYQTHVGDPQPGGSTRFPQIKVDGGGGK